MFYNSWPAFLATTPALAASEAAGKTATRALSGRTHVSDFCFKGIYFNVAGTIDLIMTDSTTMKFIGAAGTVLPIHNFGVKTGGNTTLSQGDFVCLYD